MTGCEELRILLCAHVQMCTIVVVVAFRLACFTIIHNWYAGSGPGLMSAEVGKMYTELNPTTRYFMSAILVNCGRRPLALM